MRDDSDPNLPFPAFPVRIESQRLLLRKHDLSLAAEMFEFVDRDRERLGKFLPWVPSVRSTEDEENYIRGTWDSWEKQSMFDYGIFLTGPGAPAYAGNLGVHALSWPNRRAELGYWIGGPHEGHGYVTEAVLALEGVLFGLGFHRVEIRCSTLNARSASVPERCGYRFEGALRDDVIEGGGYRDTRLYAKLRRDRAEALTRSPEQVVREYWVRMDRREFESLRDLMADEVVFDWPQTRERIRGASNVVAVNRHYPGEWRTIPRRIVSAGETVISEVTVTDGRTVVFAVSFFTVRDGLIREAREYWGDSGPSPDWRAAWVERY